MNTNAIPTNTVAHTANKTQMQAQSNQSRADASTAGVSGGESVRRQIDPKRYKTRLCRHLLQKGACPFAQNCAFAHGEHELRALDESAVVSAPNKTEDLRMCPPAGTPSVSLNNVTTHIASTPDSAGYAPSACPSTQAPHAAYTQAAHSATCTCVSCQPYASGAPYTHPNPYPYDACHPQHTAQYGQTWNYPCAPSAPENHAGYAYSSPYAYNASYDTGYHGAPYAYPPYYPQQQQQQEHHQHQVHQQHQQPAADPRDTMRTYTIDPYAPYAAPSGHGMAGASGYSPYKPYPPAQPAHAQHVSAAQPPNAHLP